MTWSRSSRWTECPDLFIARALGETRTIKLATGVSCLPNHNPLMLAQLDQMARGRRVQGEGTLAGVHSDQRVL
ncbi:MAG: hypothetical protein ACE5JD_09505 [Candidatus Methylomirabilia bacterium]